MPASPPAPGVLYHPSEKGPISPASTPHLIGCLPIHSSTTQTTQRSALLLCPHAASLLPPTKAPPFLGFFLPPSLRPYRCRTPHCHPFEFGFLVCSRGSLDLLASPTFSVSFPRLELGQLFTSL